MQLDELREAIARALWDHHRVVPAMALLDELAAVADQHAAEEVAASHAGTEAP